MSKRHLVLLCLILALALVLGIGLIRSRRQEPAKAARSQPTALALADMATAPPSPAGTATPSASPTPTSSASATATLTATATSTPTAIPTATLVPTATPTPTAIPTATPLSPEALLAQVEVPVRDLYDLTERLRGIAGPIPRVVNRASPHYALGAQETFWIANLDTSTNFTTTATLRYISPHLYMWVQDGESVDEAALARSTEEFEERIYPLNRHYFGEEWSPGVDNDTRLTVLNARFTGAAGYFSSADEYPRVVNPYSNQREMFYINLEAKTPGTADYAGTLAHEFQHMIHWHMDTNEEAWLNEGLSEMAEVLNGYDRGDVASFSANPDVQLNTWNDVPAMGGAHYDASYLLLAYFTQRFGADMLRDLARHPANGIASLEAVLAAQESGMTFVDLFADWAVANYLDDDSVAEGQYAYHNLDLSVKVTETHSSYPVSAEGTVHQFASDYVELYPENGDVRIAFTGAVTVPVVPNQAYSSRYQWWSNRGDASDTTLTRAFDLTNLSEATLNFWLWYDIEDDWDYAYVEVSTDGGKSWQTLPGRYTTQRNPNGANFGHAYTGLSGGGEQAQWVEEEIDLTPYVGQKVLIRFEYVTDEAINHVGLCLDDIRIPQLGYAHDAEAGDEGWMAAGFARLDNILPQRFLVQVITFGPQVAVQRMPLDEDGRGHLDIRGFGQDIGRAVLVISAVTPVTTEVGHYRYSVIPLS